MVKNSTLAKVRAGEPALGMGCATGDPILLEMIVNANFDWIWVETQHGYWSYDALMRAMQIIGVGNATPIVRPAANDYARIGLALDAGGLGVIVPMVNTAEDARTAVYNARFTPLGGRSSGGGRTWALYGNDYPEESNDEILLAVQIETVEALENVDEIAAVDGVDCVFIGPGDLALSMGVEQFCDEHEAALARILDAANNAGVAGGFPCGNVESALARVEQGFTLVNCGSELGMVRGGLADAIQALGRD